MPDVFSFSFCLSSREDLISRRTDVFPTPRAGTYAVELADLTFDDALPDIDRIGRYSTSAIALQRLVHVKLMTETARVVGCVPPFIPLSPSAPTTPPAAFSRPLPSPPPATPCAAWPGRRR